MYVTSATPARVTIQPKAAAYFKVAKYRCDIGDVHEAATIRVKLPTMPPTVLTGPVSEPGVTTMLSYCRGGANAAGQHVSVSPIVRTVAETYVN